MKTISSISLRNFKCHSEMDFNIKGLNVLAGINSSGKSTLIQSLLLLRQSYNNGKINKGLLLNSDLVDLGTVQDILYVNTKEKSPQIEVTVNFGDTKIKKVSSELELNSDFLITQDNVQIPEDCNLFSNGFNYISSDRIGPQKIYGKSYTTVKDSRSTGLHGELFAHMYQLNKQEITILGDTLENDFSKWLSEISLGFSIDTLSDTTSQTVELSFKKHGDKKPYKSINVGFGLSYIAPVIVTLLMAKEDDLIIIESPEAHLHPKGQRRMGELLAEVSSKGVQIITETHSDHVVNGIRLAVKNQQISKENVNFMYFYREEGIHKLEYIDVESDGQLSHWPDGFFDEWDNALFELMRR